jgi:single-strand DNA-binding protein
MNKVYLIGNLTRDPETRTTTTGIQVCNFSIAVNRRRRAEGTQETDFFNIVAWRQLAELCGKYLSKGRKVAVAGSIQTRTYEAQDGSKRNAFDIVADEVEFLSSQSASTSSGEFHPAASAAPSAPVAQPVSYATQEAEFSPVSVEDDELPF